MDCPVPFSKSCADFSFPPTESDGTERKGWDSELRKFEAIVGNDLSCLSFFRFESDSSPALGTLGFPSLLHYCGSGSNGVCGSMDDVEHKAGVREDRQVAGCDLRRGGVHALGQEALHVGMDGAVVLGRDVPARLRPARGAVHLLVEQVRGRHALGRPDELLLLLGFLKDLRRFTRSERMTRPGSRNTGRNVLRQRGRAESGSTSTPRT
jgi:hypothetical protein